MRSDVGKMFDEVNLKISIYHILHVCWIVGVGAWCSIYAFYLFSFLLFMAEMVNIVMESHYSHILWVKME